MAVRAFAVDSGGASRLAGRLFLVDGGGVSRLAKRIFLIDAGGVARLVYQGFTIASAPGINKTKAGTGPQTMTVTVETDGTISYTSGATGSGGTSWGTPTTVGIGTSYWVRFVHTAGDSPTSNGASTWTQLTAARSISRQASLSGDDFSTTFTIQLATDSGGSNVVANWTGQIIRANRTS